VQRTTPVGAYPPNHFGLYDMHGNVWEWCADWHDSDCYRRGARRNPQGPAAGEFRVLRGGCWRSHAATCRSAYRNGLGPKNRDRYTGFRVVADAAGQAPA
jgi:formylglycine-generating enzyme required for sulfatase activity